MRIDDYHNRTLDARISRSSAMRYHELFEQMAGHFGDHDDNRCATTAAATAVFLGLSRCCQLPGFVSAVPLRDGDQ